MARRPVNFSPLIGALQNLTSQNMRQKSDAENLRRYEAQRALEAARHKERLDRQEELDRRRDFGLQQKFLTEPKDPAQIESYMKEFQRRGITGASDPGTLGPTRMPEVPMYEDVQVPYDIEAVREPMGPPTPEMMERTDPIEVMEHESRLAPIPAQTGYRTEQRFNPLEGPAYDAPPTQPMARGAYDALMARRKKAADEKAERQRAAFAGILAKSAPIEAARAIGHTAAPGTPWTDADMERHIEGGVKEKSESDAAKARIARAGRSVRPAMPEPASRRLTPALKAGNLDGFLVAYPRVYGEGLTREDVTDIFVGHWNQRSEDALQKMAFRADSQKYAKITSRIQKLKDDIPTTWDSKARRSMYRDLSTLTGRLERINAVVPTGVKAEGDTGAGVAPTDAGAAKRAVQKVPHRITPKMTHVVDKNTKMTLNDALWRARRMGDPERASEYLKDILGDPLGKGVKEIIVSTASGDVDIAELLTTKIPARQRVLFKKLLSPENVDLSPGAVEAKARREAREKSERQAQIRVLGGR